MFRRGLWSKDYVHARLASMDAAFLPLRQRPDERIGGACLP